MTIGTIITIGSVGECKCNYEVKVKVKVGAELYTTMLLFQLTETFLKTYPDYVRVHPIPRSLKLYSIESLHANISTCHLLAYSSLKTHSLGAEFSIQHARTEESRCT
jgi:hypothetical protein